MPAFRLTLRCNQNRETALIHANYAPVMSNFNKLLGAVKPDGTTITIESGVISAVGSGSTVYFGAASASAASGDSIITFASTPSGVPLIVVNGAVLATTAFSLSGAVATLSTALNTGDVVTAYWPTANSTPGTITLSSATHATIRGTRIQASSAGSFVVSFPSGTQAGDLAVVLWGGGYQANTPTGWTANDTQTGGGFYGSVFSKVLTSSDISVGSVTITAQGGYDACIGIVTFIGATGGIREVDSKRNANTATVTLTTSGNVLASDLSIYFGSYRGATTAAFNRGTEQQVANDGGAASGCIYTEALTAAGAYSASVTYGESGSGDYEAIVVIEA